MNCYLIVVILNPTAKQKHDDGAVPQIIVQPQAVLAKDTAGAAMRAHKFVPDEHADKIDRLDVVVLPFQSVTTGVGR